MKKYKKNLAYIFFAALIIAGFLLRYFNLTIFRLLERWDNYDIYYRGAMGILQDPFSFDGRLPFYHYFLAFFSRYAGLSMEGLRILNIGINLFSAAAFFLFIKKFFSVRAAFFFLFLWTLAPRQIYASSILMTENFYSSLILLGLISFVFSFSDSKYLYLSAVLAATAFLTRSPFWAFYPVLSIFSLVLREKKIAVSALKVFGFGFSFFLLWSFFWISISGRAQGVESPVYVNFLEASMGIEKSLYLKKADMENRTAAQIRDEAINRIKSQPLLYASSTLRRFLGFSTESLRVFGDYTNFYALIILAAILWSFFHLLRAGGNGAKIALLFAIFQLYYCFSHSFFSYMDRFTYITDPYVLFFISIFFSKGPLKSFETPVYSKGEKVFFFSPAPVLLSVYSFMFFWPISVKSECRKIKEQEQPCKEISDRAVSLIREGKKQEASSLMEKNISSCLYNAQFQANYAYLNTSVSGKPAYRALCSRCSSFLNSRDREICGFLIKR